jgi:DNA-binding NarL/FixJ family response regulator
MRVCDAKMPRRTIRLGAAGVVLKEKATELRLEAITKVYAGEV